MFEMGLHDPFECLQHKLWLKEGPKIKVSIWFFPLKVRNRPELCACRACATYHWKDLDKGYNLALDFVSIKGLHKKLWASKVAGVPILEISGLST
jgi:hypothetical protein